MFFMFGALALLMSTKIGRAQTITITDQNPTQEINHLTPFGTTLNVSVTGQPTPNQEATIVSGPTYSWSPLSQPYQYANVPQGQTPTGSSASISGSAPPTQGWKGGTNNVSVTVTATWTDDKGASYPVPQTYTVTYTALAPASIKPYANATQRRYPGAIVDGAPVNDWGHDTVYVLQVLDNNSKPYAQGQVHETFSATQLNPKYAANLIAQQAPGGAGQNAYQSLTQSNDPNLPPGCFTDNNSWNTGPWTNPPNQDTGWTTLWFQTDQHIDEVENWSGGPSVIRLKDYTLYYQQGDTLRQ